MYAHNNEARDHRQLPLRIHATGIATCVLSMIATSGAHAQTESDSQADNIFAIEEIIVTASKRGGVSAQSLASSITAFDANKIERLDALDFDDFIVQVPGTNFLDNGGPPLCQDSCRFF